MVSEHQQGLRFDIYERVHLPDGVSGIKELDEVELVPHIQVLSHDDQAVLKGNLLLSGKYVDEQGADGRTLEHLIPVEISLPLSRVHRVEDISVDIENFDVDLLSTRSLNVTGVLSLNGVEVLSAEQDNESWSNPDEEIVFTHEAAFSPDSRSELANSKKKSGAAKPSNPKPQAQEPVNPQFVSPQFAPPQFAQQPFNESFNQPFNQQSFQHEQFQQQQLQQEQLYNQMLNEQAQHQQQLYTQMLNEQAQQQQLYSQMVNEQAGNQANSLPQFSPHTPQPPYHPLFNQQMPENAAEAEKPQSSYPHDDEQLHPLLADENAVPEQELRNAEESEEDDLQEEALDASAEPAEDTPEFEPPVSSEPPSTGDQTIADDKKEMKVAFGSKQSAPVQQEAKPYGLQSLLSASAKRTAQREQEPPQQPETPPQDAIEWKKLLLSSTNNQQQFRKMKLCIVQKDDTLESIAKRYEVNSREIALLNRLTENELRAGQIVQIPK